MLRSVEMLSLTWSSYSREDPLCVSIIIYSLESNLHFIFFRMVNLKFPLLMLITIREKMRLAFRGKSQFPSFTNIGKYGNFSSTNIKGKQNYPGYV